MLENQFDKLGLFIEKRYKIIVAVWIIALVILVPFAVLSTSITNYNVEMTNSNTSSMSQKAQNIYNAQFPSNTSSNNDTAVVLFVNGSFYSSYSYDIWQQINSTYKQGLKGTGVSSLISPYPVANQVLNSAGKGVYKIYVNIYNASHGIIKGYVKILNGTKQFINFTFSLKQIDNAFILTHTKVNGAVNNFTYALNMTNSQINGTSEIIYGIPLSFYKIYMQSLYTEPQLNNSSRDVFAENTLLNETHNFYGSQSSLAYFNIFYNVWNSTSMQIESRLNNSIETAVKEFASSMNSSEQDFFLTIYNSFNVSSYSNESTRKYITSQLLYSISYNQFGRFSPYIFNFTYQTFEMGGNVTSLSWNITNSYVNESSVSIYNFTKRFFDMNISQFSYFIRNMNDFNRTIEEQLNTSTLYSGIEALSSSLNLSINEYYRYLIDSNSSFIFNDYVNAISPNLNKLSTLLGYSSTYITRYFIENGSSNSSMYFSKDFISREFGGSPYFYFTNSSRFITIANETSGNVSGILEENYNQSGMKFNSSLFNVLVPRNFGGYIMILNFNVSSLNGTRLTSVNQYISDIQHDFPEVQIYYTGSDEIAGGVEHTAVSSLSESMIIGIIISIIIVGLYFRSAILAFIPLAFFGISYSITLGIVYLIFGVVEKTTLSFIVTTLSAILILGLSVDYSVYMLNRFVRSKAEDRLENTVKWAGHAVFTSGLTVIISYIVLALFNIPLIGDGGYVNALGITISLGVALTLLPSFLRLFHTSIRRPEHLVNFEKVAKVSRDHKNILVIALVLLFVFSLIVYEVTPTSFDLLSLIPNNAGKIGYYEIASKYGYDPLTPNFILLNFTSPLYSAGKFNTSELSILNSISSGLLSQNSIGAISTVTYPFGNMVNLTGLSGSNASIGQIINQSLTFIGKDGKTVLIQIYLKNVSFSQQAINAMSSVDSFIKGIIPENIVYYIGGPSQSLLDSSNFISNSTVKIVEILAVIIFAVLAYQLSTIFTPLRLLFNVGTSALVAVVMFYGVFYYMLHMPIIVFGPLFVIVTLFGVGLDYDIFLVTRTREEVIKGKDDVEAISEALKENAGVILALGLILAGVFGSLIMSPIAIIKEIGFSITMGVLIDTMVSWLFLIPALMLIMKKYNWWPSKIASGKLRNGK